MSFIVCIYYRKPATTSANFINAQQIFQILSFIISHFSSYLDILVIYRYKFSSSIFEGEYKEK